MPLGITCHLVWHCFSPKPSGMVGPGLTPQLTDVVQQMLCDFVMFIRKFLPAFSLKQLHLGAGWFLNTCSPGQLDDAARWGLVGPGLIILGDSQE